MLYLIWQILQAWSIRYEYDNRAVQLSEIFGRDKIVKTDMSWVMSTSRSAIKMFECLFIFRCFSAQDDKIAGEDRDKEINSRSANLLETRKARLTGDELGSDACCLFQILHEVDCRRLNAAST